MKFNKNIAAIHSYLCGDGYVIRNPTTQKNKYYYIGFRNTNNTLLLDFQSKFHEEFGIKARMCNDGRCVVQNKKLYFEFVKEFSYYSREWEIPQLDDICLRHWLRAFYDCEGWVTVRKAKDRSIGLDSVNKKGIKQIQNSLLKFNIKSKLKHLEKRDISRLYIYGKENISNFCNKIGFLHPVKQNKLQNAINSYVNYNWNYPETQNELIKFIHSKIKINKRIKAFSIKKNNLLQLKNHLKNIWNVESNIYDNKRYFELNIAKKEFKKIKDQV